MREKIRSKTLERAGKNKVSLHSATKTSDIKGYSQLHIPTRMGLGLLFSDKNYPKLAKNLLLLRCSAATTALCD